MAHGKSSLRSNVVLWRQGEQREPRGTWTILEMVVALHRHRLKVAVA